MNNDLPKYLPGFEPETIQKLLKSFFSEVDKAFPDKVIVWSQWDHEKFDKVAAYLCNQLGYSGGKDFFRAYGYDVIISEPHDNAIAEQHEVQRQEDIKRSSPPLRRNRLKTILISIIGFLLLIVLLAGYLTSTKTMKGCLAYFNNEIPKMLDSSGVPYTFEVKRGKFGTYQGYHFIECNISLSGDLSNQQIFEIIKSVESIKKPEKAIVDYLFQNGANSYSIEYDYCLKSNDEYVYSPIYSKAKDDLSISEKLCICNWIQGQYDKYDEQVGKNSGDKYSDAIFLDAENLFGISQTELKVIWMKKNEYEKGSTANKTVGNTSNSKAIDNSATNAKICAEEAVRQNLKSPSTAKFCSYTDMTANNTSGRTWSVTGYVDAQNSFGAVIRTYWTVTLTLTDAGFRDYSVDFS